ncbi:serine/threonine-protein phosphatase 2A activator [Drosophila grimshawi]|uniref:Serine/threonine-protein phosphatase 2A activator n=1 Tax=Drosophila grimshawi TaxID=7222 RepID=B4JJP6_DROGR|nr:serine/threonine-protein phosphatase 2A activator [Drosophila grimshawi]EDV99798.1 GH12521 [Drosophila grimshawi]
MSQKQMYDVFESSADALKASTYYIKRLRTADDLGKWKRSSAYHDLVAYINNTSMAIQGQHLDGNYNISNQMDKLCKIFNWLEILVYQCHPLGVGRGLLRCVGEDKIDMMASTNSLLFKCHDAYSNWVSQVQEKLFAILERQVKPHGKHINELAQYLTRSFGSCKTYDYGPDNELMFIFFLCCLFKSGILHGEDTVAAALLLYPRYLRLVRRLISFFRLASSAQKHEETENQNAIDKWNILPYIWGCAQLCQAAPFYPPEWEMPGIMEKHRQHYLLLDSLSHLQKTMGDGGVLGVHSYQLWCVLSLSNWPEAYNALMAAFIKHVLNDIYTVRDMIFGEIMSINRLPLEQLQRAHLGEMRQSETSSSVSSQYVSEEDKSIAQKQLFAVQPPLSRHHSVDADILLGFQDPNKVSVVETATDNQLRRLRHHQKVLLRKFPTAKRMPKDNELNDQFSFDSI